MKFKTKIISELISSCEIEGFEVIETTPWEDDGKYDYQDIVFKHNDKFYKYTLSRTGSYFSEYHYSIRDEPDEIECPEVEKIEKIIHVWKEKK